MLALLLQALVAADLKDLPDDLREHFDRQGIRIRREVMYSGLKTEWMIVDEPGDGGRCEMRTSFVRFDVEATPAAMRRHLSGISVPSDLNEAARLAMFHPWWRATTPEKDACAAYVTASKPVADRLRRAFLSFAPR